MEREVYWQRGILIATDFLVNSGGVIYAAQEHLIKAPKELKIPKRMLGDERAVDSWLKDHATEFAALAERRRIAGEAKLKQVIERNMRELIDLLVSDPDLLPSEAAEEIGIGRIATSERDRTVAEVMVPIATVSESQTVRDAAQQLVSCSGDMLAVVSAGGELVGVVTAWDITQASATACAEDVPISEIMSTEVVTAAPADNILDVVRKLEHFEISAMPVVTADGVTGLISADILALRTLYRLLQAQAPS
jgi:glutamate dehydrogenase (NAD(P)+)